MPLVRKSGFRTDVDVPGLLESPGVVFVYGITDMVAVKIGKSTSHPILRLRELQVGNARQLHLAAWSVQTTERACHRRLSAHRVRGEWFTICNATLRELGAWTFIDQDMMGQLFLIAAGNLGLSDTDTYVRPKPSGKVIQPRRG